MSPYAKGSGIPQVMAAIQLSTPGNSEKVNRFLSVKHNIGESNVEPGNGYWVAGQ
jgi:hypothetical protein